MKREKNMIKDEGTLIFLGILFIILNYLNVESIGNYRKGLFYYLVYFIGIIFVIYGLYDFIKRYKK